ncbi:hypothetical protein GWK47_045073 [Chionoecetes opilio]|uniref:Uncharacterized protein n=1 Tax=Chionoecetes opilio TaxID=41210 RepID=A0A8J5CXR7_CHIOP|nr:hypothetical protein GWK47_045073 [Chionoecetes opilio]
MICIFKHSQIWDLRGNVPTDVFNSIQAFTVSCTPGTPKIVGANSLRYHMFCAKKWQIESGQLPPCEDSLSSIRLGQTIRRAIWRRSLENLPDVPAPSAGHGWELDAWQFAQNPMDGGSTSSRCRLESHLMHMQRTCRPSDCSCILNGLKCTLVCKLQGGSNMVQDDAIVAQDANDSDGDSDD